MSKFVPLTLVSVFLLVALVLSPVIIPARAVGAYTPGVTVGQWARYRVLYNICEPPGSPLCMSDIGIGLNDVDYAELHVVKVEGGGVTLDLVSAYTNGTVKHEGALVDVATGAANITGPSPSPGNYFVLAGGLQKSEHVWDTPTSPTLNDTVSKTVLGTSRDVNFLNITSSTSSSYGGFTISTSAGFAYDMLSGVFIELAYSFSTTSLGGTNTIAFAIGMMDTNIWAASTSPYFTLAANPTTINTPDTSTITVTRYHGYLATVGLTAVPPSSITCSLSPPTLASGSSDTSTLSCAGSPGTYTVTVNGNDGYTSHAAAVTVIVPSPTTPGFSVSSGGPISFQTGSSGHATITITAQNGFSSTVNLSVSGTGSGITCGLDRNSLPGYGTVTLTCTGQPGTYTVIVTATSGSTSHSTPTTVTVNSAAASNQPSNDLQILLLYAAIGAAAAIAVLIAFLFLRRKPEEPTPVPQPTVAPSRLTIPSP